MVDRGDITPAEAAEELLGHCGKLESSAKSLTTGAQVQGAQEVLTGLESLLTATTVDIRAFCEKNVEDAMDFGSEIKYNYIQAVFRYKDYIESISAGMI